MARSKSTNADVTEAEAPASETTEAPSIERVTLTGRLVADPVLRKTKSGISVSTIRIAVNPPEGDATFHDVVVWTATAEAVCRFKKKGHLIEVTGRPQERTWTDKDGNERVTTEVIAFRGGVEFRPGRRQAPKAQLAA
jgi:single-strand DNA-binding protein